MSLVDPYHDRVFRNGRVYGVNYNEMTNQPTYTDISPFGGGRMAGKGLDLEPDVVIYMGKAAQGMPQDQGMDVRIAEGMLKAMSRAIEPQLRTMEFVPGRDTAEARTMEFVPGRDDASVELLTSYDMPADISYPRGRRGDNFEGIPNANDPVMREKLRNRRLRNPVGGQELPGFLGKV